MLLLSTSSVAGKLPHTHTAYGASVYAMKKMIERRRSLVLLPYTHPSSSSPSPLLTHSLCSQCVRRGEGRDGRRVVLLPYTHTHTPLPSSLALLPHTHTHKLSWNTQRQEALTVCKNVFWFNPHKNTLQTLILGFISSKISVRPFKVWPWTILGLFRSSRDTQNARFLTQTWIY